jgi:hypothetical protein
LSISKFVCKFLLKPSLRCLTAFFSCSLQISLFTNFFRLSTLTRASSLLKSFLPVGYFKFIFYANHTFQATRLFVTLILHGPSQSIATRYQCAKSQFNSVRLFLFLIKDNFFVLGSAFISFSLFDSCLSIVIAFLIAIFNLPTFELFFFAPKIDF